MNNNLMVPVPAKYARGEGEQVHVAGVLARGRVDAVQWFEIAALCEALLLADAVESAIRPDSKR